ncbi:hypothetical protein [Azotobacter beijerinckii]|uniref:Uncharacterized protein n=1 Tax=Azotobacter beijerinckii TaxID=170623 RepID=A0A1I4FTU2_9GAMM|nr:hypothetical protein [Azotobacter beijerinckii]SFB62768.1 hypothetical protein SAMN04244571_04446 [Azotobacter beijerinckii]SFL21254.1 hypothetical protein SAMN04244574_03547 [Azotobacter beijerinckii]
MPSQVHVDLDQVLDVALRGVRRASMFMGFGVNAALSPECKNYQLTDITKIQLLPNGISTESLAEAKAEFRLWIEANGFRELIETFIAYLDAVHLACLKFSVGKGKMSSKQIAADQALFAGQGFPNKLNVLEQRFHLSSKQRNHLISLNGARNVFTHRLSIVQKRDLNAGGVMRVSWVGPSFYIQESSGQRHPLSDVVAQGKSFPEETSLVMQLQVRERLFKIGDRMEFSSIDLAEICLFISNEAKAISKSLVEHAKASGIEIHTK